MSTNSKNEPIFTKKQKVFLFALVLTIIILCCLFAIFVKEEWIPRAALAISLIFGLGTILTSTIALGVSIISFRKSELLTQQKNEEDANKFINENSRDICYIPLCLIANSFDNHHHYIRSIFNNFNKLNIEVQKEVLNQLKYSNNLIKEGYWPEKVFLHICKFIKEEDLGRNILGTNFSYLRGSLTFAEKSYDYSKNSPYVMPDDFDVSQYIVDDNEHVKKLNIEFYDYLSAYLNHKFSNDYFYIIHKGNKPIDLLIDQVDFAHLNKEQAYFWVLEIAESLCKVLLNRKASDSTKIKPLCLSYAKISTYEDKFLLVLLNFYNLYQLIK